jgi:hypothetical protein
MNTVFKFLTVGVPASCAVIAFWWAIKKYRGSETEARLRQYTRFDNSILIEESITSKSCVRSPLVEEIAKNEDNSSGAKPTSKYVENEVEYELSGEETEDGEEEKKQDVEEIPKDKESPTDVKPPSINFENEVANELTSDETKDGGEKTKIAEQITKEKESPIDEKSLSANLKKEIKGEPTTEEAKDRKRAQTKDV